MKSILLTVLCVIFGMGNVTVCHSHGVDGHIKQDTGYCVTAMYDDGEPMSYAAVEIKAPDSEIAFQTGRTDRNGRFLFYADKPGKWNAVVEDGMGHRVSVDTEIGEDRTAPAAVEAPLPKNSGALSRPVKVIAGLSVIFGLCGFLYGWKVRRKMA
ncbi:MAG: carboxypeptidase-like regulatory domain-containing protein [Desulfobacterales bacterium]